MYLLLSALATTVLTLYFFFRGKPKEKISMTQKVGHLWKYDALRTMIQENDVRLPAMIVDLDVFDENIRRLVAITRYSGKSLRVATKSIRCPELIQRILDHADGVIKGLMCFSLEEAQLLADAEMDDFFIPYPTVQPHDVRVARNLVRRGKQLTLTVDCVEHVQILDSLWEKLSASDTVEHGKNSKLRIAVDLDMSTKLFGFLRLGAHRSRINMVEQFAEVVDALNKSKHLVLVGAMGYEATVAGIPDDNPFAPFPNIVIRLLKRIFFNDAKRFRKEVTKYCLKHGVILEFFNGGGSGNLREACTDDAITEVTAGSAFLQAQLFDYFVANQCSPAFIFALQCTRIKKDYISCQSGGFVASGSNSQDKFPNPFTNPQNLRHFTDEGYGEVQTPLELLDGPNCDIGLGDPVFFRPAKSGEIAEHFNHYYLKREYKLISKTKTYRGFGGCFH